MSWRELRRRWREERKRHYPTEKRITEKEEAKKAVKEAGGLEEAEKRPKLQVCLLGGRESQGKPVPLCQNYMRGTCKFGTKCKLLHDPCRKNKSLCKAFVRGYCARVRAGEGREE